MPPPRSPRFRGLSAATAVVGLAVASIALAQPPALERRAQVGVVTVEGAQDECHTRLHACDWAARASLTITTGGAPASLRVVRLEASHRLSGSPTWQPRAVRRVQLGTASPRPASEVITVPANGEHTLGVLHRQEALGRGIVYRVTLEIDGQRVVVGASEHLVIEHPRR